jgi:hypothetical protein
VQVERARIQVERVKVKLRAAQLDQPKASSQQVK